MPAENEAKSGKRMLELDILRGFAMLVVVSSHVSSVPIENLRVGRGHLLFSMLHSLFTFSVPVFFLVGALLSAYSLAERPSGRYIWPYYKKKLIRLFLPYLAWSLIYILFRLAVEKLHWADLLSFDNWFTWISQGRAYDHLYYLVVVCQFHLLFPLLLKLARLVKDKPLWAFIIIIGGYHIVYWLNKLWLYQAFPYFQSSVFWYFDIIFMGLYIGLNYQKVCLWLQKNILPLAGICLVATVGYIYCRYLLYRDIPYHSYFYYTIRLVFVISLPLLILSLIRRFRVSQVWVGRCLLWIGRYSLGIFLAHPILNFYLRKWVASRNVILLTLISVAAVVVFTAVCGFMTMLLEKFRPTAWLVGAKRRINK